MSERDRGRERLGVLGNLEIVLQLLVFAFYGRNLVDAAQVEAGLVQLGARELSRITNPRQLICGGGRVAVCLLISFERTEHVVARPCIEHLHVGLRAHELLVLELPAQVDRGGDAVGQFVHARHGAVNGRPGPPVRPNAPHGNELALFAIIGDEAPRNHERILAVSHEVGAGARTHEQLQGREQCRFAGARLACNDREPLARLQGGVAD